MIISPSERPPPPPFSTFLPALHVSSSIHLACLSVSYFPFLAQFQSFPSYKTGSHPGPGWKEKLNVCSICYWHVGGSEKVLDWDACADEKWERLDERRQKRAEITATFRNAKVEKNCRGRRFFFFCHVRKKMASGCVGKGSHRLYCANKLSWSIKVHLLCQQDLYQLTGLIDLSPSR